MPRKCKYDKKPLSGRADKKFCDQSCRNAYNNKMKSRSRQHRIIALEESVKLLTLRIEKLETNTHS